MRLGAWPSKLADVMSQLSNAASRVPRSNVDAHPRTDSSTSGAAWEDHWGGSKVTALTCHEPISIGAMSKKFAGTSRIAENWEVPANDGFGSIPVGRSHGLAAREQSHGRCCHRGGPRLSSAGIGLLAAQLPLPGHRWRRSHFSQATPPAASARGPLPDSPVVGRMSRIREHANCAPGAAHQRSRALCRTHRPPPGPRRDLRA